MTTWANAHRIGAAASLRLLRKHKVDLRSRIPLLQLAELEGVLVEINPLPRLAGAYVREEGAEPGIWINNRLPKAKQRYTLGHEIGHHALGHTSSLDENTELLTPAETNRLSDQEKLAEAFAAWLLMPLPLVETTLSQLGMQGDLSQTDVYQLSLALGSSYAATCVHLSNLKKLDRKAALQMLKIRPQQIKKQLLGGEAGGIGAADIHVARQDHKERRLLLASGDQIRVVLEEGACDESLAVDLPDGVVVRRRQALLNGVEILLAVEPLRVCNPVVAGLESEIGITCPSGRRWVIPTELDPPLQGVSESWF